MVHKQSQDRVLLEMVQRLSYYCTLNVVNWPGREMSVMSAAVWELCQWCLLLCGSCVGAVSVMSAAVWEQCGSCVGAVWERCQWCLLLCGSYVGAVWELCGSTCPIKSPLDEWIKIWGVTQPETGTRSPDDQSLSRLGHLSTCVSERMIILSLILYLNIKPPNPSKLN